MSSWVRRGVAAGLGAVTGGGMGSRREGTSSLLGTRSQATGEGADRRCTDGPGSLYSSTDSKGCSPLVTLMPLPLVDPALLRGPRMAGLDGRKAFGLAGGVRLIPDPLKPFMANGLCGTARGFWVRDMAVADELEKDRWCLAILTG